jgi:hypothetical protein
MGEDVERDWIASEIRGRIPAGWRAGSVDEVGRAMEQLARWHMIRDGDGERRYRVALPADG